MSKHFLTMDPGIPCQKQTDTLCSNLKIELQQ